MILIYSVIMVLCYLLLFAGTFFFKFNLPLMAIAVALIVGFVVVVYCIVSKKDVLKLAIFVVGLPLVAVMAFFFSGLVFAFNFTHSMVDRKLQETAKFVSIESVTETPYLLGETQIGLRVVANVRLSKEIPLDQYGLAIVEALTTSMHITPQGPFELHGYFASTTFNGQSFDELTTKIGYEGFWIGKEKTYFDSNGKVSLPVGVYKISKVFLLHGLFFLDRNQEENPMSKATLCRHYAMHNLEQADSKENFAKEMDDLLQRTAADPWAIKISGGIESRATGSYGFAKSSPIRYRYDHAQWKATLDSLRLPACKTLMQEAKAAEQIKK